jgi:hypothetical protein
VSGVSLASGGAETTIRARWLQTTRAVLACLAIGLAAALPFAGHAGVVSRFDVAMVPLGCELNDFSCSTARPAFWLPVLALLAAGSFFGGVAAVRVGVPPSRAVIAAVLGGTVFAAGALVTQATVGDNPIAMRINEALGTATLDEVPVWVDVGRQFGLSVGLVAAAFTLALGLTIRRGLALPATLAAGVIAALGFVLTTWLLDQVAGITIVGVEGPSRMPVVALVANFVAGVAGSGAAMAILTRRPPVVAAVTAGVAAGGEDRAAA